MVPYFIEKRLHYTFEWNQANLANQTSSLQPIILHCFRHFLPYSTTTPNPNCFEREVFDFLFFSFTFLPFWKLITSRVFPTPESSSPSHECLPTSRFVMHSMEHWFSIHQGLRSNWGGGFWKRMEKKLLFMRHTCLCMNNNPISYPFQVRVVLTSIVYLLVHPG